MMSFDAADFYWVVEISVILTILGKKILFWQLKTNFFLGFEPSSWKFLVNFSSTSKSRYESFSNFLVISFPSNSSKNPINSLLNFPFQSKVFQDIRFLWIKSDNWLINQTIQQKCFGEQTSIKAAPLSRLELIAKSLFRYQNWWLWR